MKNFGFFEKILCQLGAIVLLPVFGHALIIHLSFLMLQHLFSALLSAFKLKLKSLIVSTLCSTISHPLQTLLKSKWLICRGLSWNVMKCAAGAAGFDLNMWNKWHVAPGDLCSTCGCEAWLEWSVFPFFPFFMGFASWTVVDFYVFKSWSLDGTETAEYLQTGSGREVSELLVSWTLPKGK